MRATKRLGGMSRRCHRQKAKLACSCRNLGAQEMSRLPILFVVLALSFAGPHAAFAQVFADPAGSGPIVGAVRWVQGTLLGSVATVVAVMAIATVGYMMLTGRMNWRYGATVILGCFILFGAASIAAGIQAAAQAPGY